MTDPIIVMDKGRIEESGKYEELMLKKGSFGYLFIHTLEAWGQI